MYGCAAFAGAIAEYMCILMDLYDKLFTQFSSNPSKHNATGHLSDTYLMSGPPISMLGHTPLRVQQIQLGR